MLIRTIGSLLLLGVSATLAAAQEAEEGIAIPVTLSAGFSASPATAGARVMFYPTLKLGSHWFAYAALQVRRLPYFYSDSEHGFDTDVIQAYVGYSLRTGKTALVLKAGQLTTAFGSFPLRYDDTQNPLIGRPLPYTPSLPVPYGSGGAWGGFTPVSLYGLPSVEADLSTGRFDARAQIAGGSPSYPQGWSQMGLYRQWAAGAGYTIQQGFRVGASAFRGPYLDGDDLWGLSPRSFPATGIGADVQWARGHWSVSGEWQRFRFDAPDSPVSFTAGWAEAKRIVSPRLYLAVRAGRMSTAPQLASVETAAGWWLNRHQLLKVGYEWAEGALRANTVGLQLVTSFEALNRPLR